MSEKNTEKRRKKTKPPKERLERIKQNWKYAVFGRGMLVGLLILLQFAFLAVVAYEGSFFFVGSFHVFHLMGIALSIATFAFKEHWGYRTLWIFLFLAVPLFGILFWLILKLQGTLRKYRRYERELEIRSGSRMRMPGDWNRPQMGNWESLAVYMEKQCGTPAYEHTVTRYFPSGEELQPVLIDKLKGAKRYIFLEFFIVDDGVMWSEILDVLRQKTKEGVEVRLIMDDVGCLLRHPRHSIGALQRDGIDVRVFNKFYPFIRGIQNNRDHRKIVSVDGVTAFTGGINIADEYINKKVRFGYWKDTAVMLEGAAAWAMTVYFLRQWNMCGTRFEEFFPYYPEEYKAADYPTDGVVIPYVDSPIDQRWVCHTLYSRMIENAARSVWIATPYLVLDEMLKRSLVVAAQSGIDVRIAVPGIPDKKTVYLATRSYFGELLSAGVRVYIYTPGFLHAKMVLTDGEVASVGSANMDYRSFFLHFECGAFLWKSSCVADIRRDFEACFEVSRELTREDVRHGIFASIRNQVLRLVAPLM